MGKQSVKLFDGTVVQVERINPEVDADAWTTQTAYRVYLSGAHVGYVMTHPGFAAEERWVAFLSEPNADGIGWPGQEFSGRRTRGEAIMRIVAWVEHEARQAATEPTDDEGAASTLTIDDLMTLVRDWTDEKLERTAAACEEIRATTSVVKPSYNEATRLLNVVRYEQFAREDDEACTDCGLARCECWRTERPDQERNIVWETTQDEIAEAYPADVAVAVQNAQGERRGIVTTILGAAAVLAALVGSGGAQAHDDLGIEQLTNAVYEAEQDGSWGDDALRTEFWVQLTPAEREGVRQEMREDGCILYEDLGVACGIERYNRESIYAHQQWLSQIVTFDDGTLMTRADAQAIILAQAGHVAR